MKKSVYQVYQSVKKQLMRLVLRTVIPNRTGNLLRNAQELTILMNERVYLHDDEVPLLAKYAKHAPQVIVEIGSAFGGSPALLLVSKQQAAIVHSIDPFVVDSMANFQATEVKCRENVRLVLKATRKIDQLQQWVLHTDYSYNIVKKWDTPIDMLFIDGDHTYEAVKQDYEQWLSHVRTGGFILFHDSRKLADTPTETFNRGWPGPTRLAQELTQDKRLERADEAFSITVWRKMA